MNALVNFGWEYVYHCHILSHEEMDMMRPVSVALPPVAPNGLSFSINIKKQLVLSWVDQSVAETGFVVQRNDGRGWTTLGSVPEALTTNNTSGGTFSFTDTTYDEKVAYQYQVIAQNTIRYGGQFMSLTASSALAAGPQINLSWTDNATNEIGFLVQRQTNGGAWTTIATPPARNNTGSKTITDKAVAAGSTYTYRVAAVIAVGTVYATTQPTVIIPAVPAAPGNVQAASVNTSNNARTITLTWTDNANNETGFTIQRATDANFTKKLNSYNVAANATTFQQTDLSRNTLYYYRIPANNGTIIFSAWVNANPFPR